MFFGHHHKHEFGLIGFEDDSHMHNDGGHSKSHKEDSHDKSV